MLSKFIYDGPIDSSNISYRFYYIHYIDLNEIASVKI